MNLIKVRVPPMFEQAIGYEGKSRYVAFYWSMHLDQLVYEDGMEIMVGPHLPAWYILVNHKVMTACKSTFNFGSLYHEAVYWLVVDRRERRFYAMGTLEARNLLQQQHYINGVRSFPPIDMDEIRENLNIAEEQVGVVNSRSSQDTDIKEEARRRATQDMLRWLEDCTNPAKSILRLVHTRKT